MTSYLQAPEIHAEVVRDTALLGGPFIDLDGIYFNKIENLLKFAQIHCEFLIKFAASLKNFDRLLESQAQGDTLSSLYQQVPDNLRGMVELVYDLNGHPSIRFIESILYQQYYSNIQPRIIKGTIEAICIIFWLIFEKSWKISYAYQAKNPQTPSKK